MSLVTALSRRIAVIEAGVERDALLWPSPEVVPVGLAPVVAETSPGAASSSDSGEPPALRWASEVLVPIVVPQDTGLATIDAQRRAITVTMPMPVPHLMPSSDTAPVSSITMASSSNPVKGSVASVLWMTDPLSTWTCMPGDGGSADINESSSSGAFSGQTPSVYTVVTKASMDTDHPTSRAETMERLQKKRVVGAIAVLCPGDVSTAEPIQEMCAQLVAGDENKGTWVTVSINAPKDWTDVSCRVADANGDFSVLAANVPAVTASFFVTRYNVKLLDLSKGSDTPPLPSKKKETGDDDDDDGDGDGDDVTSPPKVGATAGAGAGDAMPRSQFIVEEDEESDDSDDSDDDSDPGAPRPRDSDDEDEVRHSTALRPGVVAAVDRHRHRHRHRRGGDSGSGSGAVVWVVELVIDRFTFVHDTGSLRSPSHRWLSIVRHFPVVMRSPIPASTIATLPLSVLDDSAPGGVLTLPVPVSFNGDIKNLADRVLASISSPETKTMAETAVRAGLAVLEVAVVLKTKVGDSVRVTSNVVRVPIYPASLSTPPTITLGVVVVTNLDTSGVDRATRNTLGVADGTVQAIAAVREDVADQTSWVPSQVDWLLADRPVNVAKMSGKRNGINGLQFGTLLNPETNIFYGYALAHTGDSPHGYRSVVVLTDASTAIAGGGGHLHAPLEDGGHRRGLPDPEGVRVWTQDEVDGFEKRIASFKDAMQVSSTGAAWATLSLRVSCPAVVDRQTAPRPQSQAARDRAGASSTRPATMRAHRQGGTDATPQAYLWQLEIVAKTRTDLKRAKAKDATLPRRLLTAAHLMRPDHTLKTSDLVATMQLAPQRRRELLPSIPPSPPPQIATGGDTQPSFRPNELTDGETPWTFYGDALGITEQEINGHDIDDQFDEAEMLRDLLGEGMEFP